MRVWNKLWVVLCLIPSLVQAAPLTVAAAENFYGDMAQQIAGPLADVHSILRNPDQDPHLFEADPATARLLADADIVLDNGAGYDPWVNKLLATDAHAGRVEITAAALVHTPPNANPHIWYDTRVMRAMADAFAQRLKTSLPAHAPEIDSRLHDFQQSLTLVDAKTATLRKQFAGLPVTATEPVAGYMVAALGMQIRDHGFQLAVMNDTEPSAAQIAAFEQGLRGHAVKLMLYNRQAANNAVARLLGIARKAGVPVVGVSETEPPWQSYQAWMLSQLDAIGTALGGK